MEVLDLMLALVVVEEREGEEEERRGEEDLSYYVVLGIHCHHWYHYLSNGFNSITTIIL